MPLSRPRLQVRLDAIAANYRAIVHHVGSVAVGAAVKADAYGLGVAPVARRLYEAGCRTFFVAGVEEGVELRGVLPDVAIGVFNGVVPGTAADLVHHDLTPVVVSTEQLATWRNAALVRDRPLPVGIHVDTGINRTGLSISAAVALADDPDAFAGLDVRHVLSHLASADEPDSAEPEAQLARFLDVRRRLPLGVASIANSAGVFRDRAFHLDLVRPGIALYGGGPVLGLAAPLRRVVVLEAPILQIRELRPGDAVGYGATYRVERDERHAVIPVGYADGFPRSSSNRAVMAIGGHRVPVVGRVSMDLTVLDVTDVPRDALSRGVVEVIGDTIGVDEVADAAGTISYEILTSLGRRYERLHV